jgi:hypothetical protein
VYGESCAQRFHDQGRPVRVAYPPRIQHVVHAKSRRGETAAVDAERTAPSAALQALKPLIRERSALPVTLKAEQHRGPVLHHCAAASPVRLGLIQHCVALLKMQLQGLAQAEGSLEPRVLGDQRPPKNKARLWAAILRHTWARMDRKELSCGSIVNGRIVVAHPSSW